MNWITRRSSSRGVAHVGKAVVHDVVRDPRLSELSTQWTMLSGPGTAVFANAGSAATNRKKLEYICMACLRKQKGRG